MQSHVIVLTPITLINPDSVSPLSPFPLCLLNPPESHNRDLCANHPNHHIASSTAKRSRKSTRKSTKPSPRPVVYNLPDRPMGASGGVSSGYARSTSSASANADSDAGIKEFRDRLSGQWGINMQIIKKTPRSHRGYREYGGYGFGGFMYWQVNEATRGIYLEKQPCLDSYA